MPILNFSDDRKAAQWSAGYYVNNATMRLYFLGQNTLTGQLLCPETKTFLGVFSHDVTMVVQLIGNELGSVWDRALIGFDTVFKDLKSAAHSSNSLQE